MLLYAALTRVAGVRDPQGISDVFYEVKVLLRYFDAAAGQGM